MANQQAIQMVKRVQGREKEFNRSDIEKLIHDCCSNDSSSAPYNVVSIIGAQSSGIYTSLFFSFHNSNSCIKQCFDFKYSCECDTVLLRAGKSTLMNTMFKTEFQTLDQQTEGRQVNIYDKLIVVLLESLIVFEWCMLGTRARS